MIQQYELLAKTPQSWTDCVLQNMDEFLLDHAACEKKAAGMAISMISHYPDRDILVRAMCELAVEEMSHFREVVKLIQARGLTLTKDEKDPYIAQLRDFTATGKDAYFLDRLLMGSIVEARGAERFALIAQALQNGTAADQSLAQFYIALARSEARHYELFLELAYQYFNHETIAKRLDEWLTFETDVMLKLAIRPALH